MEEKKREEKKRQEKLETEKDTATEIGGLSGSFFFSFFSCFIVIFLSGSEFR